MMGLLAKDGSSKLVHACTYPLTGVRCVTRIYTNDAVFLITNDGMRLRGTFGTTPGRAAGADHRAPRPGRGRMSMIDAQFTQLAEYQNQTEQVAA